MKKIADAFDSIGQSNLNAIQLLLAVVIGCSSFLCELSQSFQIAADLYLKKRANNSKRYCKGVQCECFTLKLITSYFGKGTRIPKFYDSDIQKKEAHPLRLLGTKWSHLGYLTLLYDTSDLPAEKVVQIFYLTLQRTSVKFSSLLGFGPFLLFKSHFLSFGCYLILVLAIFIFNRDHNSWASSQF